jgi:3-hydroxyisobutyrate dehydrogenase
VPDVGVEVLRCSAKGCQDSARWALRWNNPKLHPPERRKTWLACEAHRESLSLFLSARGFLREVDRVSSMGTVAFLGTGIMGAPMAANLARAGYPVRAWNRSRDKAEPLTADGAVVASSPAEAVQGADIVVTMLADGPTTAEVIGQAKPAPGTVWLQMGTVGVEWADRLGQDTELGYVDAPVAGSDVPARQGTLVILASGPEEVRERVQPLFDVLGSRTLWLGAAGAGSRMKLVVNNWAITLTEGLAETLGLAAGLGLDPKDFVDFIDGAALGAPWAVTKARNVLAGNLAPGFPLRLALKDARLVADAARGAGLPAPVTEALVPEWQKTVDDGYGDEDLSAVVRRYGLGSPDGA